ncbi:MAG: NAD(+) synthase [Methylococcaceae bacterium]|nr:NAD(+) synthase [Methylococcaceae bacterium]
MTIASQLNLDSAQEVERIAERMRTLLSGSLNRRGFVVAISGGVDSAVSCGLAVRAVGKDRVFGLLLPERDSKSSSSNLGLEVVKKYGIAHLEVNITPALDGLGCYQWRDEAIRNTFPAYTSEWKNKLVIAGDPQSWKRYFKLVVQSPDGQVHEAIPKAKDYLQIVAATNFKQRVRKTLEYFHADRLHYAVVGTPNRLEYDQGFFVKLGDGAADIKPIAHLYKTQVYQLARYLELPEAICNSIPTTDTFSLPQGQDEFYYVLPYDKLDIALYALNHGVPAADLAKELGIDLAMAEFIYRDIEDKRKATAPLHWSAIVMDKISGPQTTPPGVN